MKHIKQVMMTSMMALAISGLGVSLGLRVPTAQAAERTLDIVAVVNDDAISAKDLFSRMKLIMISSGLPNNEEIQAKIARQVISTLIDEQVMLQETSKRGFTVSDEEIQGGFATIGQQNNMSGDKFKEMLQKAGIDISTMERQIRSQIGWGKVVQDKLRPKVVVSERDIDDVLERLKSRIGTPEYLAAEIFLPVSDPKQEKEAMDFAQRLVKEIRSGKAPFFKLAQQFSKGAGAERGGDMGWLSEAQASEDVVNALKTLEKNQVSDPVRGVNGIHVLYLRDTRTMSEDNLPSRDQVLFSLGTQRLERLQYRHLMDLKASSFIDIRA